MGALTYTAERISIQSVSNGWIVTFELYDQQTILVAKEITEIWDIIRATEWRQPDQPRLAQSTTTTNL